MLAQEQHRQQQQVLHVSQDMSSSGLNHRVNQPKDFLTGPSMRRLVLDHNPLGDRGLLALASGCPKGQGVALTELGLEACSLGCLCPKPLTAILQDWTSLRQLTLSWNNLGLRGEQAGRTNAGAALAIQCFLSMHALSIWLPARPAISACVATL